MVASRQTALTGADFDTWLNTLRIPWTPAQIESVRRAYALSGEPELAVADLLADLRMDHEVVTAALLHEPVATGRLGSRIHSLHEPAYNREPFSPAASIASRLWHAVRPDPQ